MKTNTVRSMTRAVALAMCTLTMTADIALAQSKPQMPMPPANSGAAWADLQRELGGKGAMQPGDVLKFGFPRTDLNVKIDGLQLKPAFALGSWLAFKRMSTMHGRDAGVAVMGDLVLTEDEINPVMLALQNAGIEQTAVHNHLLHESPRIMYMHVMAHGDAVKIAHAIRGALASSATPLPPMLAAGSTLPAAATPATAAIDLDTAAIARILGFAGKVNGGVYQVAVARLEKVIDHGMEIPPSMGIATALNFQPTGNGRAVITGDFVMSGTEVNKVIRVLRQQNISVTALHSHLLTESPRLLFMHFWANDDAVVLARGLRSALDQMAVKRAGG